MSIPVEAAEISQGLSIRPVDSALPILGSSSQRVDAQTKQYQEHFASVIRLPMKWHLQV